MSGGKKVYPLLQKKSITDKFVLFLPIEFAWMSSQQPVLKKLRIAPKLYNAMNPYNGKDMQKLL